MMDIANEWAAGGPTEDHERAGALPAFLEVTPGEFESIEQCTAAQFRAAADSKLLQARALMDEARNLYERADRL